MSMNNSIRKPVAPPSQIITEGQDPRPYEAFTAL